MLYRKKQKSINISLGLPWEFSIFFGTNLSGAIEGTSVFNLIIVKEATKVEAFYSQLHDVHVKPLYFVYIDVGNHTILKALYNPPE